jgi:hypothetical protein
MIANAEGSASDVTGRTRARGRLRCAGRVCLPALLAGLVLALLLTGLSLAAESIAVTYNGRVDAMISQITTPTLEFELEGLTGERPLLVGGTLYTITTRYSYRSGVVTATQYAYEQFDALGLDVAFHTYTFGPNQWRNVVAEKPGTVDPDGIYLITAHIDDYSGSLNGPAPGADDNASGSIAVLTAARLLAPYDLAHTVRFVLFTGEEQGLLGSAAYAARCVALGEDIRGVVNLDMLAYNSNELLMFDLYASPDVDGSLQLAQAWAQVVDVYGIDLSPHLHVISSGFPIWNSDQWSFLQRGIPAFMACEDTDDFTPYLHTVNDRVSTLDLDYYASSTRAAVATIAHLAGIFQPIYLPLVTTGVLQ